MDAEHRHLAQRWGFKMLQKLQKSKDIFDRNRSIVPTISPCSAPPLQISIQTSLHPDNSGPVSIQNTKFLKARVSKRIEAFQIENLKAFWQAS
jgi:hypothetical protein